MYTLRDVIDRIRFNTATAHDLIGKNSNNLFSNKNIIGQLKFALDDYAKYTKALQYIYSLPVDSETSVIDEPPRILRSEGIRFLVWFINGYAYPLNYQNLNNTYGNFPTPIQGLPKWFNYWDKEITFYPQNSNGFNTTRLGRDIKPNDRIIHVESTKGFPDKCGRFTIGDEKISYERKDGCHFYDCKRGIEGTQKSTHKYGECVKENNVWIYYYGLHFTVDVAPDDTIREEDLDREMQICDEHIKIITDWASFNLLSKVDSDRAGFYKVNFTEWLEQAKLDIIKDRSSISKTRNIREMYEFETDEVYWGM